MPSQRPLPRPKRTGEEFARTHFQSTDGDSASNGHSAKKPRFDVRNPSALAPDAIEDDIVLEADEIGKRGQQAKRNAVNIDGYESDSSNEGFDTRADVKAKEKKKNDKATAAKSKDEEDHDMFADLEDGAGADGDDDEELTREGKKRSKNVRFLGVEEIEGQVASSTSGGHVSADFSLAAGAAGGAGGSSVLAARSSLNENDSVEKDEEENESESDVGEADRAAVGSDSDASELGAGAKKQHAPLLDAFNMRSEQEEGRFDEQGNFVRKAADPDAVHDTWLEGVSKKDMRRAREAAGKRDEEERHRRREEDAMLTSDLLKRLIPLLERGETPLEALARLGRKPKNNHQKQKRKSKPKWHNKKSHPASDPSSLPEQQEQQEEPEPDTAEQSRLDAIETITATTSLLLSRDDHAEIYSTERELLTREYQRETGDAWVDRPRSSDSSSPSPSPSLNAAVGTMDMDAPMASTTTTTNGDNVGTAQWEYRWADKRDGGAVHGPYDGATMASWHGAGYFGEGVEFRVVRRPGSEGEVWRSGTQVRFV